LKNLDLRPLSVGEILDRTFTLYRTHFLLFLGISAIPHIFLLIPNITQTFFLYPDKPSGGPANLAPHWGAGTIAVAFVGGIVGLIAYVFAQGASVTAVSELYLGRSITISESYRRVFSKLGRLILIIVLAFLSIIAGFLLFIFPGIYLMCRLLVTIPSALIENLGATTSMSRSFELTRDNAGRAFLIILLYYALAFAAAALFAAPFQFMMLITAARSHPESLRTWMILTQIGSMIATVLVKPVVTIAGAILYYDLRVRKEAFDLQMMMNPPLGAASPVSSSAPSMLS
jgi:hypothetical protein